MRIKEICYALAFSFLVITSQSSAQEDYSQWAGSVPVVLNTKATGSNVSGTVTKFPVLIRLTPRDSAIFFASQITGLDIRFAKPDGAHLPYQIEQWDPLSRTAAIWVLLDTVRGNDSAVYARLYYGKFGAPDSSRPAMVFDTANGFQAVWHLSDLTGQNAVDATINGFAGTPTGAFFPQDYQGVIGRAKDFDGAAACYSMNNSASGKLSIESGGPMTLSAWINTDIINGGKYVLSKGEQYGLYFRSTAPYNFGMMEVGADNRKRYAEHDSSGFVGKWRHVVGIRTAAKISLYVDGQWVSDSSYAGSSTRATTAVLNIGRQQPNSNQWFDGRIDEVEIANVVRSADWIKLSFENQKAEQTLVTVGGVTITPPPVPPAAPLLVTPLNGATGVALSTGLAWGPVPGAATYRVQLSNTNSFSSAMVDDSTLTATSKAVSGLANGVVYYWRANAKNASVTSPWSAVWSFTAVPPMPAGTLKFVAYGDTRTNQATHQNVVNALAKENPELVLNVGDLWGEYGTSGFNTIMRSNPGISRLLDSNKYLISRGNHETFTQVQSFTPTLVRNNKENFAFAQGNCFFVVMGFDPGLNQAWVDTQLSSPASKAAKWRFVISHKAVYSSGTSHGADGNTSEGSSVANLRAIFDRNHVSIFFAGHDHIYERSKFMYNGAVVDSSDNIPATKTGTVYVVTGGGGAPFATYASTKPAWCRFRTVTNEYCVLNAGNDSLTMLVKDTTGQVIDMVTLHQPPVSTGRKSQLRQDRGPLFAAHGREIAFLVDDPGHSSLLVFNPRGALVADYSKICRKLAAGKQKMRLSGLPAGMYIFSFDSGKRKTMSTLVFGR